MAEGLPEAPRNGVCFVLLLILVMRCIISLCSGVLNALVRYTVFPAFGLVEEPKAVAPGACEDAAPTPLLARFAR